MRGRETAQRHQEPADYLAAGEPERFLEQPHPLRLGAWVMGVEPDGKGAVAVADRLQPPGIVDGRVDLEAVADDARIAHQAAPVAGAEFGDRIDVEGGIGLVEGRTLHQNGEPGEAGLVDLQPQPLEEYPVIARRKPVVVVVIWAVNGVSGSGTAISGAHGSRKLIKSEATKA